MISTYVKLRILICSWSVRFRLTRPLYRNVNIWLQMKIRGLIATQFWDINSTVKKTCNVLPLPNSDPDPPRSTSTLHLDLGSISSTFYEQLFSTQIPKAQKRPSSCQPLLALLGSACVKAAYRTLMKLTPGLNVPDRFTVATDDATDWTLRNHQLQRLKTWLICQSLWKTNINDVMRKRRKGFLKSKG